MRKKTITPKITHTPENGTDHTEDLVRLKRIKGQIEGLERMVENKRYCIDILDQMKSVFAALKSVENLMLQRHIKHCVHDAIHTKEPKYTEEKIKELIILLNKR